MWQSFSKLCIPIRDQRQRQGCIDTKIHHQKAAVSVDIVGCLIKGRCYAGLEQYSSLTDLHGVLLYPNIGRDKFLSRIDIVESFAILTPNRLYASRK
jgi:hypothetical protein